MFLDNGLLIVALWLLNVAADTGGQLAFKAAAVDPALSPDARWGMAARPWVWLGLCCFVAEFGLWLAFLSLVPLSQGVLLAAITTVAIMLGGRIFFKEALTRGRIVGITLITAGVAVVGLA